MKRFWGIAAFLFLETASIYGGPIFSYSTYKEDWVTVDAGFGIHLPDPIFADNSAKNILYTISAGLTHYSFRNWSKIGYFFHGYAMFSNSAVATGSGLGFGWEETPQFQLGFMIGLGFRKSITMNIAFRFGPGLYLQYVGGVYKTDFGPPGALQYEIHGFNAGLGFDAGIRIALTDSLLLNVGVITTFDILSIIFVDIPTKGAGKYNWVTPKPYVGFGLNFLSEKSGYVLIGGGDQTDF